jgi:hypothetical protein
VHVAVIPFLTHRVLFNIQYIDIDIVDYVFKSEHFPIIVKICK